MLKIKELMNELMSVSVSSEYKPVKYISVYWEQKLISKTHSQKCFGNDFPRNLGNAYMYF